MDPYLEAAEELISARAESSQFRKNVNRRSRQIREELHRAFKTRLPDLPERDIEAHMREKDREYRLLAEVKEWRLAATILASLYFEASDRSPGGGLRIVEEGEQESRIAPYPHLRIISRAS